MDRLDAWARGVRQFASRVAIGALLVSLVGCAAVPGRTPERFPSPFQIIAHRGASAYAPENTLPAFERAWELGAYEVELDVQLSKDDVVVIFHDATLDQKTNGRGRVRDHDFAALQRIEIGSWFDRTHPEIVKAGQRHAGTRLVSLEKTFETFGDRLFYHVEIKSSEPELPLLTLDVIEKAGMRDRVKITSFSLEQLERVRAVDRELFLSLLIRDETTLRSQAEARARTNTEGRAQPAPTDLLTLQKERVDAAAIAGCNQVGIASHDLSREIIAYARGWNMETRAWRIKSDDDMRHAIEMGAHGMTTNWPDRLIRELVEHYGSGTKP